MSDEIDQGAETAADASTRIGRDLLRRTGQGALGTILEGAPYVSLVQVAADRDGAPLLLLSDLAQHARNLAADPAVSLLLDGTAGLANRLSGPRLTILGRAERLQSEAAMALVIARHPASAAYRGFADFRLYRIAVARGHLVAGFGRTAWLSSDELLGPDQSNLPEE